MSAEGRSSVDAGDYVQEEWGVSTSVEPGVREGRLPPAGAGGPEVPQ